MKLSVNLNSVFDEESFTDRVASAAATEADAVGVYGLDASGVTDVAEAAREHGLEFAYASSLVGSTNDPEATAERIAEVHDAIELAETLGIQRLNVSPGADVDGVDDATQFEAVLEVLRGSVDAAREAGVSLTLEPLNTAVDHPGTWLSTSTTAFELAAAVDDPHVGVLFDIYHQQITEGNVTATLTEHLDHVEHVHVADVPGRSEPGTGELDYPWIVETLAREGYEGYVECEFWPEGDPAEAVRQVGELIEAAT